MLRKIATILNIILLGLILYLFIISDEIVSGGMDIMGILVLIVLILFPITNILALNFGNFEKDNFIKLYFKRKTLEEREKISELENKTK
ncbi:MAG: hypothetical protein WC554_15250 [Clostridia bacterium]|jgi:hypothetical protein